MRTIDNVFERLNSLMERTAELERENAKLKAETEVLYAKLCIGAERFMPDAFEREEEAYNDIPMTDAEIAHECAIRG